MLEAKGLTRQIFEAINGHLAEKGLMMREGARVDATLITAPPSSKGRLSCPVPKARRRSNALLLTAIGVDATSGLIHTLTGTAGNVSDVTRAHALLNGDEIAALGDAGYQALKSAKKIARHW